METASTRERDPRPTTQLDEPTSAPTIVVGASRGLGRGIAETLAAVGRPVVALARDEQALAALAEGVPNLRVVAGDGTDPVIAGRVLDRYDPSALVLVAGANPLSRPLHHHTWETFSTGWNTDVRMTFHWLREALLRPLRAGSRVIVISSGAALRGSPLSGGYAGAKATQRFITAYAQEEATRARLGLTFTAVLPGITPLTELGRAAVSAYAARAGVTEREFLEPMGPPVSPASAGAAVLELLQADPGATAPDYRLTGSGLIPLA